MFCPLLNSMSNGISLTTIERGGRREMERPKVGPKGETRGIERVK
jgi:hypothetical protein